MRVNDLGSPKLLIVVCLGILILLGYANSGKQSPPAVLAGVVSAAQEQDGQLRAVAVESQGQRFVVRVTDAYLAAHETPRFAPGQEVEFSVTNVKAVKRGIICELTGVLKAGPLPDAPGSTPQGHEALGVDDLNAPLGVKSM